MDELPVSDEQDPAEGWTIQDVDAADWALARIADAERELAENARIIAGQIARLKMKEEQLAIPLQRRADFFRGAVAAYAITHRPELLGGGRKKSRTLPHGSIGWRKSGGKLTVTDKEALLEWARGQPVERNFVRIKEEPAVDEIKLACAVTGEVPPGAEISPEEEDLVIKADGAPNGSH